jgi:hypothetical protein
MLKSAAAVVALGLLAACQSSPDQSAPEKAAPPTVAAPPTPPAAQCYAYTAQDTVYLTLSGTAPATGNLIYHYAGKDRNRGTIQGSFSGDTLRADYTFQSEGTESVREVVFVRRGNGLAEGYGPVTERGGKIVFRQPHRLQFDTKVSLLPVACKGQ